MQSEPGGPLLDSTKHTEEAITRMFSFALEREDSEPVPITMADELMDAIIEMVEARSMLVGGGYHAEQPEEVALAAARERAAPANRRPASAPAWRFGFGLTRDGDGSLTETQAYGLLRLIIAWAETRGLRVAGGYAPDPCETGEIFPLKH